MAYSDIHDALSRSLAYKKGMAFHSRERLKTPARQRQVARTKGIMPRVRLGRTTRATLALALLGVTAFIAVYNFREISRNPDLGTNYVYQRRSELVRLIEGISPPTNQGMINLFGGDGMRFVVFLAEHLPEDTLVIFPTDKSGYLQPPGIFENAGYAHLRPILHPRKWYQEIYDFRKLPYDPLRLSDVPPDYRLITREYSWRSQLYVLQAYVSPNAKRYRLFIDTQPVVGNPNYNTRNLLVAYPEGES